MLVQLIANAARNNTRAIVIRQQGFGSLVTIARKTNAGLVVEEIESKVLFVEWLNEADEAEALPLVGWSQHYDSSAEALVFRPVTASGRADSAKRAA